MMADETETAAATASDHHVNALSMTSMQGKRTAPDEVLIPSTDEDYLKYRKITDFREPHRIPPIYLQGTKKYPGLQRPDTPLIAFINAKSGGRVGPTLATILFRSIGQGQVFDVTECRPQQVLSVLWQNLTAAEAQGDSEAKYIRENLRILVAGGDGTVTWVLGAIMELGLSPAPPVAVMPLGTGNDFSFNFGWGTKFNWAWVKPLNLYRTLERYKNAEPRLMDVWKTEISAPAESFFQQMPHSLRQLAEDPTKATARFWNYFSVGLDAEAAYGFHHLRETHPRLASGRMVNQAWYSMFSCTTGWFCGAQPLSNTLKLRARDAVGGEWREIEVPSSVRAIVLLNLQSYGGGRDIWGLANSSTLEKKGLTEPIYDDNLIEVLGFRSGWHTAGVMGQVSSKVHAKRLAQCREVEMELVATGSRVKGETGTVYMQLDGEPWPQTIPAVGSAGRTGGKANGAATGATTESLKVRISHAGQSRVLVNGADMLGSRQSQWMTQRGLTLGRHWAAQNWAAGV